MGAVKRNFIGGRRFDPDNPIIKEGNMPIDENGFYHPPAREQEGNYGKNFYLRFVAGLPPANAFISRYDADGDPDEVSVGEISGLIRRWDEITTKKGDTTNVAEIELNSPGTEWHGKVATIFAWSASLFDCLDWAARGRTKPITLRRLPDDGKRHVYVIRQDEPNAGHHQVTDHTQPPAKGQTPTTASGWSELYRVKFDGGANQDTLNRIIAAAAEAGYSWDADGLRFISVTTSDANAADINDLPF